MPIYFRSKQVKGVDYVFYNGKSYKRTGKYVPKSTTNSVPLSDIDIMYVESCSAAELGNLELDANGTLTVPTSTSEFQLKYKGENSGDTGILVLEDDNGNTCNISLSVNAVSALVFDVASSGVPSPHTFVTYPTTLDYVDCLSNQWKITFASKGSYYLVFDWQGKSKFVCGEAEIDLGAIYNVGSDSRTGLGGQIHADPDDSTSPGYSLKYRTLNYGVDTQNGTVGRPIILEDVIDQGENVEIFMRGTNGTGPAWEAATGENLATNEFGLSATAGGFANGESWDKLVFPTGTYSTSATLFYGNSARICFSGIAATGANGDRHFTVLRELIDVKSIPTGGTSNVQVEYDGETFLRFEGTSTGDTATVVMSAPAGHTCSVMLSVDSQQNLVFNAGDLPNSLLFTTFPDTQQYVDCMGDEYDVTFTGKGSYRVTVGNMKPFMRRNTGIAKIDERQGNWYNYNVSGVNNGKYEMTMQNWSNIKTPDKTQPAATVIQENPDINITLGDGITFDVHHFPIKLPGDGDQLQIADAHPLWIKTVQSPGKPGPGETPPGVIINNGLQDTPNFTNKYRFLRFRPTEAGTYYYNCEHHASMSGKIVVTEASVNPPVPQPPSENTHGTYITSDIDGQPGIDVNILKSEIDAQYADHGWNFMGNPGSYGFDPLAPTTAYVHVSGDCYWLRDNRAWDPNAPVKTLYDNLTACGDDNNPYPNFTSTPTITFETDTGNSIGNIKISNNYGDSTSGENLGPHMDESTGETGTGTTINLQPGKTYTFVNTMTNINDTVRFTKSPGNYNDPAYDILILDCLGHSNPPNGGNTKTLDVDAVLAANGGVSIDGEWYIQHEGTGPQAGDIGKLNIMNISPPHPHWPSDGNKF